MSFIPFNRIQTVGAELGYIQEAFDRMHISGDGVFTRKCSQLIETVLSVPKVLLTTSCTHALEMAALLLDLKPGDEVIVPSFTFVSTVNAMELSRKLRHETRLIKILIGEFESCRRREGSSRANSK